MDLNRVAVLGGGPGGLFFARLLKLKQPGCHVVVYEQLPPEQTFGFGVGLQTATQRNLSAADPELLDAILSEAWSHEMSMSVADVTVTMPVKDLIAIGRATLLDILREHARAVGVQLEYGERVTVDDLSADLIVAADGVSSATRDMLSDAFGPTVEQHDELYLWCGADFALDKALFRPETSEHGTFVAHAYPYSPERSTFLIETDPQTWRNAGFDDDAIDPDTGNDEASITYLSELFAAQLGGRRLIGNRTRWLRFRTVTCRAWHTDNVVLLGDAAATAHYSIGSGTKLAMESGIALMEALTGAPDLTTALRDYEDARRPQVEHLQSVATRSMRWWDDFAHRLDTPVEQLLVAYMTRAGKVPLARFADSSPAIVRAGLAQFAGTDRSAVPDDGLAEWVLERPLETSAGHWPRRIAESGAFDDPAITVVDATGDRDAALTAFAAAERKRFKGAVIGARVCSDQRALAAEALVGGRIDLVEFV